MSELNSDLLDEGLQSVMGKDRCQIDWEYPKPFFASKEDKTPIRKGKAQDAQWEPVKHNQMDKIKACAKDALLFGGLSLLFFYFQQTGQMAMTASMPCICTCVLLCGIGIGKHSVEG